jgi:hypothetical protein
VSNSALDWPGLSWLRVQHDLATFHVHVEVSLGKYTDTFTMHDSAIGVNGADLLKEAYLRRAQLMVVSKIAKELK